MPMKKSVSIILSVLVLLTASLAYFSYASAGAYAADGTSAEAATEYISSESDFMNFIVDCGIGATKGKTYILTTDIYLTRYYAAGGGSLGRGAVFEGTLDGRGHAIVGVGISDGNVQNAFFKEISPSATVKDLKFIDAEVSGSDVATLAIYNYGSIENVSVTGTVKGLTAAGIAVFNFGAIRNCLTAATLTGSEGTAFAATASGSEAAGFIPEEYTAAGYTPLYEISGCYGLSGQNAAVFVTDGKVTEPDNAYAAAGGVNDYALLKWYIDNYSASDEKPKAAQKAYINCYNVALTLEENAALEEAIGGGYYSVAHYGFLNAANTSNSALTSHDTDYSTITGTDTGAYTASATLEGEGTKESPYLINNVSDLLAIDRYDDEQGRYFLLTADINLYVSDLAGYYPASGAFVTELEGTLDGNGKTVSALAGALIGAITASGRVTSLNVIGNGANGLVAETNNGIIEYVYADNCGTITRSTVKTGGGVANTSSGTVSYTRHYGGSFFATSGTSAEYSYNVTAGAEPAWNSSNLTKCVSVNSKGEVSVSEDTDITSLVTVLGLHRRRGERYSRTGIPRRQYCVQGRDLAFARAYFG